MKALYIYRGFIFARLSLLVLLASCSKEPLEINIDPQFQVYVNRFIEEGAKRGIEVDFSNTGLVIEFGDVPADAAGVCSELGTSTSGSHIITIKRQFWLDADETTRERLIFHELGHCELFRPHDNQRFSTGEWKSVMRGAPLPEGISPVINFSGIRRDYYIDELFNSSIGAPNWLNIRANYNDVPASQKQLIFNRINVLDFQSNNIPFPEDGDFEIEVEMRIQTGLTFAGFRWSGFNIQTSFLIFFYGGNELNISSGSEVFGPMHVIKYNQQVGFNLNKMTVRKQGDFYYVFMNEEFLYWFEYLPMRAPFFESLRGPDTFIDFQSVKVYTL